MNNGWVKLHRKMFDKGYYKKSTYIHLWVHILMKANHKEKEFFWNGENKTIKRGQFITGRKKLHIETGISESTIERILKMFEKVQQIEQQATTKFRLITVKNYGDYQGGEQQADSKRTASGQQADTNKNDKNDKNEKKCLTPPSFINVDNMWIEMLKPYKNKYSPLMVEKFTNHFRAKNFGGKKEHWQKQKTFDMGRRLANWAKTDADFQHEKEARQKLKFVNEKPTHRNDGGTRKQNRYFNSIGELIK